MEIQEREPRDPDGDVEVQQEMGEEEDPEDDPILELIAEADGEANPEDVDLEDPPMPPPQEAALDVVDLDAAAPLPAAPLPPAAPPELGHRAVPVPPLARGQAPNKRHGQHEKSFQFGVFFVKFRDDRSEFYPDRIPSWTVFCPVHENCNLESFVGGVWVYCFHMNLPDLPDSSKYLT